MKSSSSLLIEYTTRTSKQLVQRIRNTYIEKPDDGVLQLWKRLDGEIWVQCSISQDAFGEVVEFPYDIQRQPEVARILRSFIRATLCQK